MIQQRQSLSERLRGFTLIEVLVVVAIIALLVSILLPSMSRARKQARRAVCASQLHQLSAGLLTYSQTYRQFPQQAMINVDPNTKKGEAFGLMTVETHKILARYLKTGFKDSTNASEMRSGQVFHCPDVPENERSGDALGQDQIDPNAPPYLHTTYMYLARLNDARNDPAICQPSWGDPANCNPRVDIPSKRKLYVVDEPDSQRALMSDLVMYWGGKQRWRINHGPWYQPAGDSGILFEGSMLAFGDGHAVWQPATKFPAILRQGGNPLTKDGIRSANLFRNPDLFWW